MHSKFYNNITYTCTCTHILQNLKMSDTYVLHIVPIALTFWKSGSEK